MMYGEFAAVYDGLMADIDYDSWAVYYLELARQNGIACMRAADSACGTGSMTLALAAHGVQITGLDRSEEMLRVAAGKARAKGRNTPFIRQDMRKLSLHRPLDAVFCVCDGLNYLVKPSDVLAFFAAAYQALRPGGGLLFDISTKHKLARTLGNRCLGSDDKNVSYIWQNHYDAANRVLQMDLTFFVQANEGVYRRFDETHVQRAHEVEEIMRWLTETGFEHVCAYGDRTFTPPRKSESRIHFIAKRP